MVKRALRYLTCLRSMAAAAKHNERNNNDPAAVVAITKQIAETVVIHTESSFKPFGGKCSLSLDIIL